MVLTLVHVLLRWESLGGAGFGGSSTLLPPLTAPSWDGLLFIAESVVDWDGLLFLVDWADGLLLVGDWDGLLISIDSTDGLLVLVKSVKSTDDLLPLQS